MATRKKSWFDEHVIVLCDDDNMKSAIENKIKKDILDVNTNLGTLNINISPAGSRGSDSNEKKYSSKNKK